MDELLEAWIPYVLEVESFHQSWQKPVVITEIGYRSLDGANMRPWDWEPYPSLGGTDDIEYTPQRKPTEAILKMWYGRDSLRKKGIVRR